MWTFLSIFSQKKKNKLKHQQFGSFKYIPSVRYLYSYSISKDFTRSTKYFFILENALKKTTEYFLKFRFLFESTILLPVNNEKNFIQMAGSAGHAVAYTIGSIFKHIIDCCISPMASQILFFKASIVSGLSA